MTLTDERNKDTLPVTQKGEKEMPTVECPECVAHNARRKVEAAYRSDPYHDPRIRIHLERGDSPELTSRVQLEGIITCMDDGHERPITIKNNMIDETAASMPIHESDSLNTSVPPGIKQDIQEVERTHFGHSYKASVVMCRRAMQLGLEHKGVPDGPLGKMIDDARKKGILKDDRAYALALAVKDYGDGGAHRLEEFTDSEVRAVAFAAVKLLNDIYRKPASKSRKGSSAT